MLLECPNCQGLNPVPEGTLATEVQCNNCRDMLTVSLKTGDTAANRVSSSSVAAPAAPAEPPGEAPEKIGPYVLKRRLGAGAMGEVWLAYDSNLDREVAVKILPPAFAQDQERLKRFLREAKLAAKLDHPNTVTIHYAGVEGKRAFIAMQYVDGVSLEKVVLEGRPLPWREATRAIREAAAGLAAAHLCGLVHRDIKPANLMRTS